VAEAVSKCFKQRDPFALLAMTKKEDHYKITSREVENILARGKSNNLNIAKRVCTNL